MSKLDGRRRVPTSGEWDKMKPNERCRLALEVLGEAILHENRPGRCSMAVAQGLYLAQEVLGFKLARPADTTPTASEDK